MSEILNGRIRKVALGFNDRGGFQLVIDVDFEKGTQAFIASGLGCTELVPKLLQALFDEPENKMFDQLVGTACRIVCNDSKIIGLGHLFWDKWVQL